MPVLQVDDPLDAIAVHAFNGTWGVIAVGLFAGEKLISQSYGFHPYSTNPVTGASDVPRNYGCFMGGNGRLLAAQIVYSIWLGGTPQDMLFCLHLGLKYSLACWPSDWMHVLQSCLVRVCVVASTKHHVSSNASCRLDS